MIPQNMVFIQTKDRINLIIKKACGEDIESNMDDDLILEFLRSLIFAHPCNTTRAGFLGKCENKHILYSPWAYTHNNSIVLRIYSEGEMFDLCIPYSEIELYVAFLTGKIVELGKEVKKEAEKDKEDLN